MKIKEMPRYERPREKLMERGCEALSDGEILALVLGTGSRGQTALDLAHRLLADSETGLRGLADRSVEELSSYEGVGAGKAVTLLAAFELGKRLAYSHGGMRESFLSSDEVGRFFMERMRYLKQEVFNILLVDSKGCRVAMERVSMGDLNSSIVHPREVFRVAIRHGAYGVFFAHNHPSGDPSPSPEDIETTRRLCQAGELLGIHVLDHVIIGNGCFTSLRAEGIIT